MDALLLLTPEEMGKADRRAPGLGAPVAGLMHAAGRAVARAVQRRFRPVRTLVLAGPGNNGGDGWVAARLLEQAGWPVAVAPLAAPRPGSSAAAAAWRGPVLPFSAAEAGRAGLVIDALFGAGLARPLEGTAAEVLTAVRAPVVAVDVPSGLDGATGAVRGHAPQAALTVTFVRAKPGHFLLPGRALCGELVVADIGMPTAALAGLGRCWRNAPGLWRVPRPGAESHKYSRGHVTVLAGPAMTGAARLAAMAARRTGAGLCTIAAPDAATASVLRSAEPGTMVSEAPLAELLADARRNVWVIGPGLPPGTATLGLLRQVVAAGRQVVADAGALSGPPEALAGAAVLTPHAGEFARVFGPAGEDRLAAARAAAARTGSVVLLKGSDTVIAAPDARAAVNTNAPATLATGGTGDVLAGTIAGLLAQGMPPFEAACAAAWAQGEAASRIAHGLLPEDLINLLPVVLDSATNT